MLDLLLDIAKDYGATQLAIYWLIPAIASALGSAATTVGGALVEGATAVGGALAEGATAVAGGPATSVSSVPAAAGSAAPSAAGALAPTAAASTGALAPTSAASMATPMSNPAASVSHMDKYLPKQYNAARSAPSSFGTEGNPNYSLGDPTPEKFNEWRTEFGEDELRWSDYLQNQQGGQEQQQQREATPWGAGFLALPSPVVAPGPLTNTGRRAPRIDFFSRSAF